jgi:hypothetical protein
VQVCRGLGDHGQDKCVEGSCRFYREGLCLEGRALREARVEGVRLGAHCCHVLDARGAGFCRVAVVAHGEGARSGSPKQTRHGYRICQKVFDRAIRFVDHPLMTSEKNAVGNAFPTSFVRKNWPFAGSLGGTRAPASTAY